MARGALQPGGVIVEGTAGNTGIGLGMVAAALGFRTVIVIPETQAQEKKDMLRLLGAELRRGAGRALLEPEQLRQYSGRLAETLAQTEPHGAVWANQFDNVANRRGHYETTGPEIWEQTERPHRRLRRGRRHRAARWPASAWRSRSATSGIKIALADP